MISQTSPKYQQNDSVIHKSGAILLIVDIDQWLIEESVWVYIAMSIRTNHKVFVRENEIKLND